MRRPVECGGAVTLPRIRVSTVFQQSSRRIEISRLHGLDDLKCRLSLDDLRPQRRGDDEGRREVNQTT